MYFHYYSTIYFSVVSLIIVCIGYMGISGVLTLMVPYYLQDADAPLPHAFRLVELPEAAWVVALGAMFGLSTSLLGSYCLYNL